VLEKIKRDLVGKDEKGPQLGNPLRNLWDGKKKKGPLKKGEMFSPKRGGGETIVARRKGSKGESLMTKKRQEEKFGSPTPNTPKELRRRITKKSSGRLRNFLRGLKQRGCK